MVQLLYIYLCEKCTQCKPNHDYVKYHIWNNPYLMKSEENGKGNRR